MHSRKVKIDKPVLTTNNQQLDFCIPIKKDIDELNEIKSICKEYNIEYNLANIREAIFALVQIRNSNTKNVLSEYSKLEEAFETKLENVFKALDPDGPIIYTASNRVITDSITKSLVWDGFWFIELRDKRTGMWQGALPTSGYGISWAFSREELQK